MFKLAAKFDNLPLQVSGFVGMITRLRWEAMSKKEWTYVETIIEATIFPSEYEAESCFKNYHIPNWVAVKPLSSVERDLWGLGAPGVEL